MRRKTYRLRLIARPIQITKPPGDRNPPAVITLNSVEEI